MIIQPGHNSPSILDSVKLVRTNSKRWIDIYTLNESGDKVDIVEEMTAGGNASKGLLELFVSDLTNQPLYSESYYPVVIPDTRRIKKIDTGRYGINWGEVASDTSSPGTYLFNWTVRETEKSEESFRTQVIEIVDPSVLSLLPRLRLQIDKSIKVINPEEYCTLGYSDAQLVMFLKAGLERISAAQPYPGWMNLYQFPIQHGGELLISCAVLSALESQYLFAVDTDVPSFSDQGHSFVVTHATQIQALYNSMLTGISTRIREFKLHYVKSGSVGVEFRIGWGFFQMVAASPPGSTFKGHYSNTMGM
jgi:hypothetical protein